MLEAVPYMIQVFAHAFSRLFDSAAMIDLQLPEPLEMREPVRLDRVKSRAKPCQGFEQMAEQIAHAPGARHRPPFQMVGRNERNQMVGALDLLLDLF